MCDIQTKIENIDIAIAELKQTINGLKGAKQLNLKAYLSMPAEIIEETFYCSRESLFDVAVAQHQLVLSLENMLLEKELTKEKLALQLKNEV